MASTPGKTKSRLSHGRDYDQTDRLLKGSDRALKQNQTDRHSKAEQSEQIKTLKATVESLKQQNNSFKEELYQLYQQNIKMRDQIAESQRERMLLKECQEEIDRNKEKHGHTEREQIKDRIIMKLEDELITSKILLMKLQIKCDPHCNIIYQQI